MAPDRTDTPRTARAARWLQTAILSGTILVGLLRGRPSPGWLVFLVCTAGVFKLLELAVLDEHRTRVAAGATTEDSGRGYRGH